MRAAGVRRRPGGGGRAAGLLAPALLCAAVLAAQGPARDATARLLKAAADSSGRTSLHDRAVALRALGRPCTREAVPELVELGQPYRRPWVIWHAALASLSACPYQQLAPLWRELITFPRRPVREIAIVGLLRTGVPGDLEAIRDATRGETDPLIARLAERADSLLRLPVAERAEALGR